VTKYVRTTLDVTETQEFGVCVVDHEQVRARVDAWQCAIQRESWKREKGNARVDSQGAQRAPVD